MDRPPRPEPAQPQAEGAALPAVFLETAGWRDGYRLLDSGNGRKLEAFGALRLIRPDSQAIWAPHLTPADWAEADAEFDATVADDEHGRWRLGPAALAAGESWTAPYEMAPFGTLLFSCRFTAFRHVGLFPEQAPHWAFAADRIAARRAAGRPFRLLNLFGYTGAASLTAAAAGAEVVHVDASKKAIQWARDNQAFSSLLDRPIRWICDDAVKFAAREVRRGARYDGIVLDPPKFGRGPKNETFDLVDDLPGLMRLCAELLSPEASFLILTAYAVRLSYLSLYELTRDAMGRAGGEIDAGELVIREASGGRFMSTSLFARWSGPRP